VDFEWHGIVDVNFNISRFGIDGDDWQTNLHKQKHIFNNNSKANLYYRPFSMKTCRLVPDHSKYKL